MPTVFYIKTPIFLAISRYLSIENKFSYYILIHLSHVTQNQRKNWKIEEAVKALPSVCEMLISIR